MNSLFTLVKFLLGVIVSWPIYFDVKALEFLLFRKSEPIYFGIGVDDFPLPIGTVSLFIIMVHLLKVKHLVLIIKQVPVILIIYFSLKDIGIFVFLFIALYLALTFINKNSSEISDKTVWFTRGWLAGGLAQCLGFLFSNYERIFLDSVEVPNIFGYQIYSFWVSYSAVMSILFISLMVASFRKIQYLPAMSISFVAFLPIYLAARKAAFLDITLTSIFIFWNLVVAFPKLSKSMSFMLILLIFASYMFYDNMSGAREVSLIGVWSQRAAPYIEFVTNLRSLNASSFLFGYEKGFGGYSNLLVDIFVRSGLVGIFVVMSTIFYQAFLILKKAYFNGDFLGKILLFFVVCNLVVGNLANLNITQPFYIINFLAAFMVALRKRSTRDDN